MRDYVSCVVFLLLVCSGDLVLALVKTWKFNVNVENRANWIGGTYSEGCRGLIFPENFGDGCMMALRDMVTSEIVLPVDGEVVFPENSNVVFSEKARKCIRLKRVGFKYWVDPKNWLPEGNNAVPDVERLPCQHDDVVFPGAATFAVVYPDVMVEVNSISIRGRNVTNNEWQDIMISQQECGEFIGDGYEGFPGAVSVRPNVCTRKDGCPCHDNDEMWDVTCFAMDKTHRAGCSDPILPIGHCRDFCGGMLHIIPGQDFDLETFKKHLPEYENVDIYASKVRKGAKNIIQVTLADGDVFSGDSVLAACSLHDTFNEDMKHWRIKSLTLHLSGLPYNPKAVLRNALWIIFGTFFTIVLVFVLIYMTYVGPLRNYRLPFGNARPTSSKPFVFARFDNRDEGSVSMAGSILSLDKVFANPLFGRAGPSVSMSTLAESSIGEEKAVTSEPVHENPIFDEEAKAAEEVEEIET